jgi:hypothetical protein
MRNLLILFFTFLIGLPICSFAANKGICQVIAAHPSWYNDAKTVQEQYGVPVSVQMAIIHEESHFKAAAKNPRSSAYGYAQAVNQIWSTYKASSGNSNSARNNFADATQFIGWYAQRMHKQINVSPKSAYNLYLAYHDGAGGYLSDMHKKHAPTKHLAENVQNVADQYKIELTSC